MKRYRVINVWHIGAWNRNVGDWALAYQVHKAFNLLGEEHGLYFRFYMVDSQRTFFHPALVDQLNEEADLVIIGGGGLVFSRPEDQSVSGWSFNIGIPDMLRIKKPIVVFSIGYNRFMFDESEFPPIAAEHLQVLQEKAVFFSVRNQGTRRVLITEFALKPEKIRLVSDPGIWLFDRRIEIPELNREKTVIAINWANDRPHHRYPKPYDDHLKYFLESMQSALLSCVDDLDAQVLFLPHLLHLDTDFYAEFAEPFNPETISSTHITLSSLYPPPGELLYPHIPFFTHIYRNVDLVLGMRLHSCILGCAAGKKFIPIGSHPKLTYFSQEVGVPEKYRLPLIEKDLSTPEQIALTIKETLADAKYQMTIDNSVNDQIACIKTFIQDIFQELYS